MQVLPTRRKLLRDGNTEPRRLQDQPAVTEGWLAAGAGVELVRIVGRPMSENITRRLRLDNPRRLTYEQIEEAFTGAADEIERLRQAIFEAHLATVSIPNDAVRARSGWGLECCFCEEHSVAEGNSPASYAIAKQALKHDDDCPWLLESERTEAAHEINLRDETELCKQPDPYGHHVCGKPIGHKPPHGASWTDGREWT